jgi:DNA-binding NtrC family response regulator
MKPKCLLFVDDEEEILDILVDYFSDEDYRLHTAKRVSDAMNIMDQYPVDFVLSDLKLPDASGMELLDNVRMKNPDAVRVLTSGYLDVKFGQVSKNVDDGTIYLSKPWDLSMIRKLVDQNVRQ